MEIRVGFMQMTAMNKFIYLFGAVSSIFSCLIITGLIGALLLIRFKFKKERLLLMFISVFLMNLKTLESLVIALSV